MQSATVQRPRGGWSERESQLLAAAARDAHDGGLPLRQVFERVAFETGRKPNSIRNYYYALLREDGSVRRKRERFIPFPPDETKRLVMRILAARAAGQSVRSCVQRLAEGDQQLMLRYQNKYRAVLKSQPELIEECLRELDGQGVKCRSPYQSRSEAISRAMAQLQSQADGDPRILSMLETLSSLLPGSPGDSPTCTPAEPPPSDTARAEKIAARARDILAHTQEFIALNAESPELGEFCGTLLSLSDSLESALTGDVGA